MTVDLSKPVRTQCGYPARVERTDLQGHLPILATYESDGQEWPMALMANGTHQRSPSLSLVNVPTPEPLMVTIKMTPEDAARLTWGYELFRAVAGVGLMDSYSACLAHFTALAEQQRGEG